MRASSSDTRGATSAAKDAGSGDEVDLEPVVRDAVLLALPLAPLCGETCAGPDPESFPTGPAGERRLEEQEAEEEPAGDPRSAALRELRLDDD